MKIKRIFTSKVFLVIISVYISIIMYSKIHELFIEGDMIYEIITILCGIWCLYGIWTCWKTGSWKKFLLDKK
jgi:hypothetical protein